MRNSSGGGATRRRTASRGWIRSGGGTPANATPGQGGKEGEGRVLGSHWQTTPRHYLQETCLTAKCHPKLTPEQAIYEIESVKSVVKGKMREAEVLLGRLAA